MKSYRIKPTLTAVAALSLAINLSAQRHGPAAAAEQANLLQPHPELWPRGLRMEIHQQMWKRWQQSQ